MHQKEQAERTCRVDTIAADNGAADGLGPVGKDSADSLPAARVADKLPPIELFAVFNRELVAGDNGR